MLAALANGAQNTELRSYALGFSSSRSSVAQAPRHRLSYNFLYWFKAARPAHRARPGPRPGLRSCLRPAPARPAPVPRTEESAA